MTSLRTLACSLMLLATTVGEVAAQFEEEPPRIVVGPMVGVSIATLRGSGADDADVRSGVIAGGFATFAITPYFAFEPQVFYIQKGANYHEQPSGTFSSAYALTYLEIPLLFKARYPVGSDRWPLILSAITGAAIGLNTGCDYIATGGARTKCGTRDLGPNSFDPEATGVDYSAVFGVGVDVWHVAFQARYDYSFTQAFMTSDDPYFPTGDIKNQVWELTLGYKIAIN